MSQASVNYKSVLDDLRVRRARLDTAISAIEELLGEVNTVKDTLTPLLNVYADMTIAGAAIHYLKGVGRPQATAEIVKALRRGGMMTTSKNAYRTVYNSLNTKLDKGEITKSGGKWGLAEWEHKQ